jgi:hypothetical protein
LQRSPVTRNAGGLNAHREVRAAMLSDVKRRTRHILQASLLELVDMTAGHLYAHSVVAFGE